MIDTFTIRYLLRINPLCFIDSNTVEDLENFVEHLKKVFEVMHTVDTIYIQTK